MALHAHHAALLTLDTSRVTGYNSRSSFHKGKRAQDVGVTRLLHAHRSLQCTPTRREVAPRFRIEAAGANGSWFYLPRAPHLCECTIHLCDRRIMTLREESPAEHSPAEAPLMPSRMPGSSDHCVHSASPGWLCWKCSAIFPRTVSASDLT